MSVLLWWLGLVGLLSALLWAAYRQPPRCVLSRQLPPSGFAGGKVPLQLSLSIQARLPTRLLLEDTAPRQLVPERALACSALCWGELALQVQTQLSLNRYGVYSWPAARLHWADPLGLFWHSSELPLPTTLEVYPQAHSLLLPELLRPLLSEGQLSRTLGLEDPLSLRGARNYQPGDPPGRIHWRLSARTGQLTVRELEYTASSSLSIYLDLYHASEVFVDSAVTLAASIVQEAQTLGLPSAVAVPGMAPTPTGTDTLAYRAALLALARAKGVSGAPTIRAARPGSNLMILTQYAGDKLLNQAMQARATASRVSVVALPEGFYLEPGQKARPQWANAPDTIRRLEAQAGALAQAGVLVFILRGDQSVLRLGASE